MASQQALVAALAQVAVLALDNSFLSKKNGVFDLSQADFYTSLIFH